ncbi:hypothetical protein RRG08_011780 [Elysia crispata]|uniref:Uncharacterized protein n=1 Tax=Elysia crispata TaxID=231223 RepID=A0AAE1A0U2_9GAST|nr:hypothetical protein RRG08_011780 [Elysia crispata]
MYSESRIQVLQHSTCHELKSYTKRRNPGSNMSCSDSSRKSFHKHVFLCSDKSDIGSACVVELTPPDCEESLLSKYMHEAVPMGLPASATSKHWQHQHKGLGVVYSNEQKNLV